MCIFRKTRCCIDGFTALQGLRSGSKFVGSQSLDIDGEFGRFEIWAENIGALQAPNELTSLDYRLRNSTGVTRQVEAMLDDIAESLQEFADTFPSIAEQTADESPRKCHPESPESASEDDDRVELLTCVSEGISALFKVSVIIRKATHRDRYARAAASDQSPFDPRYDIAHVREKFQKVRNQEGSWLAERLGRANARRRQFLRYCRNHKERSAYPSGHELETESADNPRKRQHHSPGSHEGSNVIEGESKCALTSASTLRTLHAIDTAAEIEFIAADNLSQTSFTSTVTERAEKDLSVVPLEDVSGGNPEFECPYCYQIQQNVTERRWRKHVFADLRAYICVNKDCSDLSFPDSGGWVEHEFDAHQRAWKCSRCSETYTTRGQFVDHMASLHSNSLSKNQLSELVEICWFQRPQVPADDCPFCDEWAVRLREINQHVPHDLPVLVSKKQYRQHVGAHMEQLALFAIGPSQWGHDEGVYDSDKAVGMLEDVSLHTSPQADGSEPESPSNKAVGESDQFQAIGSHEDSTSNITHFGVFSESDSQREARAAPAERKDLRFACPYWQRSGPTSQGRPTINASCVFPGFPTVGRVKEHLYRRHMRPPYCVRCGQLFTSQQELDSHHLAVERCPDVPEKPAINGITDDQVRQLRSRRVKEGVNTEKDKWINMYFILFPDDRDAPSPYCVSNRDAAQLASLPSKYIVQEYEDYTRRELPRLFPEQLEGAYEELYTEFQCSRQSLPGHHAEGDATGSATEELYADDWLNYQFFPDGNIGVDGEFDWPNWEAPKLEN